MQKVVPAGKGSTTTESAAALGPLLATPSVKVSMLPDVTGFGEAAFVKTRSAAGNGVLVGAGVFVGVGVVVGVDVCVRVDVSVGIGVGVFVGVGVGVGHT